VAYHRAASFSFGGFFPPAFASAPWYQPPPMASAAMFSPYGVQVRHKFASLTHLHVIAESAGPTATAMYHHMSQHSQMVTLL
jgi:hypothetical protein